MSHPFSHSSDSVKSHDNGAVSVRLTPAKLEHRLGATHQQEMTNSFNTCYYGPVVVGGQEMQVVYDTGSDWLVLESNSCESCPGSDRFDHTASPMFSPLGNGVSTREYGSATLYGTEVNDTVCLGPLCEPGFEWFLITD